MIDTESGEHFTSGEIAHGDWTEVEADVFFFTIVKRKLRNQSSE